MFKSVLSEREEILNPVLFTKRFSEWSQCFVKLFVWCIKSSVAQFKFEPLSRIFVKRFTVETDLIVALSC